MRVPAQGRKGSAPARLSGCAVAALAAHTGWPSVRLAAFADSWGPLRRQAVGELDCNGLRTIQRPARPSTMWPDPLGPWKGRLHDNRHYVGPEEPSIRFISGRRMPQLAGQDGYRQAAGDEARPRGGGR